MDSPSSTQTQTPAPHDHLLPMRCCSRDLEHCLLGLRLRRWLWWWLELERWNLVLRLGVQWLKHIQRLLCMQVLLCVHVIMILCLVLILARQARRRWLCLVIQIIGGILMQVLVLGLWGLRHMHPEHIRQRRGRGWGREHRCREYVLLDPIMAIQLARHHALLSPPRPPPILPTPWNFCGTVLCICDWLSLSLSAPLPTPRL